MRALRCFEHLFGAQVLLSMWMRHCKALVQVQVLVGTSILMACLVGSWNLPKMQQGPSFQFLQASGDVSDEMRTKFSDLALSIFTRSTPKDALSLGC